MHVRFLSLATIFTTFCLLVLGGVVHNTQSSLACPDWPLCYGELLPRMEGGILIEHSHRLLASLVGLLTIFLTFFTYLGSREHRHNGSAPLTERSFQLSSLSLFLVIVQGLLGGITVIYRLPTIVSTSHLALSMVYFVCLILLDHEIAHGKRPLGSAKDQFKKVFQSFYRPIWKHLVLFAGVLVYLQMILGAFVRHVGAGASCGLGPQAWNLCFDVNTWEKVWWPASHPAEIHMTHRYFALVVTLAVVWVAFKIIKELLKFQKISFSPLQFRPTILVMAIGAIVSVLVQVLFGVLTVYYNLSNLPTTLHLTFAAVLLAFVWKLYLMLAETEKFYGLKQAYSWMSDLVELTKPKLSALVMMTVLVGLMLAPDSVNFFKGLFSLVLIFFLVAGATTLNCYLERDLDSKMERTRLRSLPAGRLNPRVALTFGSSLFVLSVLGLAIWVNLVTAILGALAAVLYLFAYTPLKRKTPRALYIGAIPGAIPPVMGWTTVMGEMTLLAWLLFSILFVWQLPHFLAISIYHAGDYDKAGIKVYPNENGMSVTKRNIFLFSIALIVVAILPGFLDQASLAYTYVAVGLSAALLIYSFRGFFIRSARMTEGLWARRYFIATVAYLPLLLGSMIFLR